MNEKEIETHLLVLLSTGKSEEEILYSMQQMGFPEEVIAAKLNELKIQIRGKPPIHSLFIEIPAHSREAKRLESELKIHRMRRDEKSAPVVEILMGAMILTIGLIATITTYRIASRFGGYWIFAPGASIGGAMMILYGWNRAKRKR